MCTETIYRVIMLMHLEPLRQILVGIDEFYNFIKNNVRLVLLGSRTKDFSVLVPVKIPVITCQNTVDERFSVLSA